MYMSEPSIYNSAWWRFFLLLLNFRTYSTVCFDIENTHHIRHFDEWMDYDECKALFSLANCENKNDRGKFKQLNEQGSNSLNGTHWKCHCKTTNQFSERRKERKTSVEQRISLMRITICFRKKNILTFSRGFCSMFCIIKMCCFFFFSLTTRFFRISHTQFKREEMSNAYDIHKRKVYIYNKPMHNEQPPIFICILNRYFHFHSVNRINSPSDGRNSVSRTYF